MFQDLLSVFLLMHCVLESNAFTEFQTQPFNNKKPEGGIAYFTCMVTGLESNEYVSWIHNGKKISKNERIVDSNDRYVIDENLLLNSFNLHIRNLQRRDRGQFICTVYKGENEIVAESQSVNLTILEIPREHYPICLPIQSTYNVGQTIKVTCKTEVTDPLPVITWKENHMDVTSEIQYDINDDSYEATYSTIAIKSIQSSIFTCVMTTPANGAVRRNCSSGPINVLHAPQVRIEQTSGAVEGKEVIFICYSQSNPPDVKFEWEFNPMFDKSKYSIENNRILRISNIIKSMNGTNILCKVTNSVGSSSKEMTLFILRHIPTSKESTENIEKSKAVPNQNMESPNEIRKNSKQKTKMNKEKTADEFLLSLIAAIGVACIVVIIGLALIPVGYMKYTRRQASDTISRGRPMSIPDVYFEPRDHMDPMLPQFGLSAPWMRTVGVQAPGECEYDETYTTQVMPQLRQVYYSQTMYPPTSL